MIKLNIKSNIYLKIFSKQFQNNQNAESYNIEVFNLNIFKNKTFGLDDGKYSHVYILKYLNVLELKKCS